MNISKLQAAVFATGLLVGALAVAGAWWALGSRSTTVADKLGSSSTTVADKPKTSNPAPQPVASVSRQPAACALQPVAAVAGQRDGQFQLQADLSGKTATDIASFVVVGKEAAAAGRSRDAEVAFLMSCLVADKLKGAESVESANAKYQLGWHYARVAQLDGSAPAATRAELRRRAELFYSDSLQTYRAHYGEAHEKSRFAADGLAALREPTLQAQQQVQPAPAAAAVPVPRMPAQPSAARSPEPVRPAAEARSAPAPAPAAPSQPRKVEVARAAPAAPQVSSATTRPSPSFDCGKARSQPEKIICSDAELAQLDRELGRLYARAKNSTSDSAAFRRQNDQEWRRRESTCRDRECLLNWYAHRRDQLMNNIDGGWDPSRPTAYR